MTGTKQSFAGSAEPGRDLRRFRPCLFSLISHSSLLTDDDDDDVRQKTELRFGLPRKKVVNYIYMLNDLN